MMQDLGLKTFNKLYPMMIRKYQDLIIDQNATEKDKINQIIQKLNALGKLSNDVVRDWNTVYQWAMNDGLKTDVDNKVEAMKANGELDTLLQGVFASLAGDMTTLHTTAKDTLVNSINEVDDLSKANQTKIGDLTALQTADKDTLVNAINDNVVSLAQKAQQTDLAEVVTADVNDGSTWSLQNQRKYANKANVTLNLTKIFMNQNAEVSNLTVNTTDDHGIHLPDNASKVVVKNANLTGSGSTTVYLSANNVNDVKVIESIINSNNFYPVLVNYMAKNGKGLLLALNSIYSRIGDGIEINLPSDTRDIFRDIRIIGNGITADNPVDATDTNSGFAVGIAQGQDVVVVANVAEGSRREALHIEDCSENVTVVANVFNDCNLHGCTIHDNTRSSGTLYAKFPTIVGNHFKAKNNAKTAGTNGMWIMNVAGYGYLKGGTFTDNRYEGFDVGVRLDSDSYQNTSYNLNGSIVENCNTGIYTAGGSVAGSITCRNVGKLIEFGAGGVIDRVVSTSPISENDLFKNTMASGIAEIRSFRYPLNPVTLSPSTTTNVALFKLPKYMKGILHVKGMSNVYGTYSKNVYDISWDGTTLTGATQIINDKNGSYTDFSLITEGGYLKCKVANYNFTTANLIVEFNGSYLFDKTIV
jgi:hypothetical protein